MFQASEIEIGTNDAEVYPPNETSIATAEMACSLARAGDKVLEIGTGSGYIAIAIAKFVPNVKVLASDINPRALAVAQSNAERNGVSLSLHLSDFFDGLGDDKFDLIVSHPPAVPYLESETWKLSDGMGVATNGGIDGSRLVCRTIVECFDRLNRGGCLVLGLPHWSNTNAAVDTLEAFFSDVCIAKQTIAAFFPLTRGVPSEALLWHIRQLNDSGIIAIDFAKSPPESLVSIIVAREPR